MTAESKKVRARITDLLKKRSISELRARLKPDFSPVPPKIRNASRIEAPTVMRRWAILEEQTQATESDRDLIFDQSAREQMGACEYNIENFIGTVKVPVGVAGPLRINGTYAKGDYYLPLATTEAALVASYHRGSLLLTEAGGCSSLLLSEGISRAPCFTFASLADIGEFMIWASSHFDDFKKLAESTTRHGKLLDFFTTVEGNHCYLNFEFSTGDAAGQNMVTIATAAVCNFILETSPIKPLKMVVESNLSGDKKASFLSFLGVRGKKVTAETLLPARLVKKHLHVSVEDMQHQWQLGMIGGVMSGTVGAQSHYANALAALFIATGQDAACVAEAAVGVTRLEKTTEGDLYASVTMPNLIVGSVGGGTKLPTQAACARIARIASSDPAREFAEVCASLCLAGELSIIGALCAGHFSRAHQKLARSGKST